VNRPLASLLFVTALSATAAADPVVREHGDNPSSSGYQPGISDRPRYRRRPGPRFMMPLKIDIGAAGANTTRGFAPGIGAAIGIHWASLSPRPTDTDIGVGVFGALLVAPQDTSTTMDDSNGVAYGGAYLEVGHTLSRGNWWRTWASGRGEYLRSAAFGEDGHTGFGATGRLSAEIYVSGVGVAPSGLFLGTYAIGAYIEAGARDMASDIGAFHVGGGLTFRTPLVFSP
jgi:hypothetical protein